MGEGVYADHIPIGSKTYDIDHDRSPPVIPHSPIKLVLKLIFKVFS
jgi:hypothetical protein